MFYGALPLLFEKARDLRNRMTDAEFILWQYLKNKQLGVKFRRQHPIALYIIDFYCHQLKLVIEVDGSIHEVEEVKKFDLERQVHLEELGLTVIRFTNDRVLNHLENVLKEIKILINLQPPLSGGG